MSSSDMGAGCFFDRAKYEGVQEVGGKWRFTRKVVFVHEILKSLYVDRTSLFSKLPVEIIQHIINHYCPKDKEISRFIYAVEPSP